MGTGKHLIMLPLIILKEALYALYSGPYFDSFEKSLRTKCLGKID
jgi:hypothetical protein